MPPEPYFQEDVFFRELWKKQAFFPGLIWGSKRGE